MTALIRVESGPVRTLARVTAGFAGGFIVGAFGAVALADFAYKRVRARRCNHLTAAAVAAAVTAYRAGQPTAPRGAAAERTVS